MQYAIGTLFYFTDVLLIIVFILLCACGYVYVHALCLCYGNDFATTLSPRQIYLKGQ